MTGLTKAMLIIAIVFAGVIWLNVVMWRRMRRALRELEARGAGDHSPGNRGEGTPIPQPIATTPRQPGEGRGPVTDQ